MDAAAALTLSQLAAYALKMTPASVTQSASSTASPPPRPAPPQQQQQQSTDKLPRSPPQSGPGTFSGSSGGNSERVGSPSQAAAGAPRTPPPAPSAATAIDSATAINYSALTGASSAVAGAGAGAVDLAQSGVGGAVVSSRRKHRYSESDDRAILSYMDRAARTGLAGSPGGNRIWKEMEMLKVTQHPWQSMRDHYLKILLPRLHGLEPKRRSKRPGNSAAAAQQIAATQLLQAGLSAQNSGAGQAAVAAAVSAAVQQQALAAIAAQQAQLSGLTALSAAAAGTPNAGLASFPALLAAAVGRAPPAASSSLPQALAAAVSAAQQDEAAAQLVAQAAQAQAAPRSPADQRYESPLMSLSNSAVRVSSRQRVSDALAGTKRSTADDTSGHSPEGSSDEERASKRTRSDAEGPAEADVAPSGTRIGSREQMEAARVLSSSEQQSA